MYIYIYIIAHDNFLETVRDYPFPPAQTLPPIECAMIGTKTRR